SCLESYSNCFLWDFLLYCRQRVDVQSVKLLEIAHLHIIMDLDNFVLARVLLSPKPNLILCLQKWHCDYLFLTS
ncbi:hypothetical protein THRCLA_20843, partial [Thraustotheca clavata]